MSLQVRPPSVAPKSNKQTSIYLGSRWFNSMQEWFLSPIRLIILLETFVLLLLYCSTYILIYLLEWLKLSGAFNTKMWTIQCQNEYAYSVEIISIDCFARVSILISDSVRDALTLRCKIYSNRHVCSYERYLQFKTVISCIDWICQTLWRSLYISYILFDTTSTILLQSITTNHIPYNN